MTVNLAEHRLAVFLAGLRGVLEHFRDHGPSCTSWGRSPARNAQQGGDRSSQHLTWTAVDLVWDQIPELGYLTAVAREHGLEVVREADHDHLELKTLLD